MDIGKELARLIGAKLHMMARLRAVGGDGEALRARRDQLDTAAEALRRQRDKGGAGGDRTFLTD